MSENSNIQNAWAENADEWIRIMEKELIPSRKFTNRAIVACLLRIPMKKILDCGCGEGWLSRKMTEHGKNCSGMDFTPKLLEVARKKGPETFIQMGYDAIENGAIIPGAPFDAIIFNFSLYKKDGLSRLLTACQKSLRPNGYFFIQTIHPSFLEQQGLAHKSQWIGDSWKGLPGNFTHGHRWYARTLEDWKLVFLESNIQLLETQEVTDDQQRPVSVLFTLKSR